MNVGLWAPIKISRRGPKLSHLFFANDLVLFAKATLANCETISSILEDFCVLLGQKVSLAKSRVLFSDNMSQDDKSQLSAMLDIPITTQFGKYLGCPIHQARPTKQSFQFIIENIEKKISNWNNMCVSFVGRNTLFKFVIEPIPVHVMHCNFLPKSTLKTIDRSSHNFLRGTTLEKWKMHAVSWNSVTKDNHWRSGFA